MKISLHIIGLLAGMTFFAVMPSAPAHSAEFCEAMAERANPATIWWGRFSGGREDPIADMVIDIRTEEACFATERECRRWIYALQSEYGFHPIYNECRKGYTPGARVTPWWSPNQP